MKKLNIILSIFIFYIILNMIIFPDLYINQTLNGITAWAFNVLPSILPFIIFTKLLSSLGTVDKLSKIFSKPCKLLFNTPSISSFAFLTSIISGYPVGAKITADLYANGKISKSEAFRMTSFCSTSGPMFIIGAVGIGMLNSAISGYIIFIAHILGSIINGILYRKLDTKSNDKKLSIKSQEIKSKSIDFSSIIIDSVLSILSVGAIIALFFVIITSLSPLFSLFPSSVSSILEGFIEITKGCIDISSIFQSEKIAIIACTFVISFGGLSSIIQSMTMLNNLKMPIWLFVIQKLSHAFISTLIAFVITLLI